MSHSFPTSLRHQLLIAMPQLADPNFAQTVTWLFEHDEGGAMGVVINRPIEDVPMEELLAQLDVPVSDAARAGLMYHRVCYGGPVHANRGFVIFPSDPSLPRWSHGVDFGNGVSLATSRDVLEAIASGHGPAQSLVALGYAGWSPGQLEREIGENAWLAAPADLDILFAMPFEQRWSAAARRIGVDLSLISQVSGHA